MDFYSCKRTRSAGEMGEYDAAALVMAMASRSAVVIFGKRGCCMSHAVKRLLSGMGVSPSVVELDGANVDTALARLLGTSFGFSCPVVFIGGKLLGSVDTVMASHINGSLVPLLKEAGALWL